MLYIVFRKIINNKYLMLCLLAGFILVVAMVASIPMYTDAILQRMLYKDLEAYQVRTGNHPGKYTSEVKLYPNYSKDKGETVEAYNYFANRYDQVFIDDLGVETITRAKSLSMSYNLITRKDGLNAETSYLDITGITDIFDHVTYVSGRQPSDELVDGVMECVITQSMQVHNDIFLGVVYAVEDKSKQIDEYLYIKPVGVINIKDTEDLWWPKNIKQYKNTLLIDYALFNSVYIDTYNSITTASWHNTIDYSSIKIDILPHFLETYKTQLEWTKQWSGTSLKLNVVKICENYQVREEQLRTTLWVLQSPILLMLAFYIFMVSQLVIENEKGEIAIFKSRGASKYQIFGIYLLQSIVLSSIAVITGPFVAKAVCTVLGSANGFLELVSRTALNIEMRNRAIQYSIIAGILSVIMMVLPAVKASNSNIVESKQKKAKRWHAPIWQKMFLDVIFIGTSLYGLYQYNIRQKTIMVTLAEGMQAPIDPFLFIISTLFILGAGLLFLRIYPYIIQLIYKIGQRFWSPVLYASFVQVGRSTGKEQFLMLFLILTLSIGLFSANSARTINQNTEDKIYYAVGADMKFQVEWNSNLSSIAEYDDMGNMIAQSYSENALIYTEPNYDYIIDIVGVEHAAKVLKLESPLIKTNSGNKTGVLMAITPDEFGEVVWSTDTLFPYNINEYLNLLTYYPNAVLVSSAFRDELDVEIGDSISYTWSRQGYTEGIVSAFVDSWPNIDPLNKNDNFFVIANLNYVQKQTALEPYEIWFDLDDNVTISEVYTDIEEKNLQITTMEDTRQEIISAKNDPLLQGTNGAMTLGFVVTMAISGMGFLIYWILSIKSRVLQFGIFRAMGMTKWKVIGMLLCEQVMISVVAILAGIIIGGIASDLFVPLLQMVYGAAEQIPPFRVVASRSDYQKIYAILGFILTFGLIVLGVIITRIKMSQALKLGED